MLKQSLKNNAIDVLDNRITNLHPDLYQNLLADIINNNVKNTKKSIEAYVRLRLNTNKGQGITKASRQYWLCRGWDEGTSYIRMKEYKSKTKGVSVFSQKFWLSKINPATNKPYTIIEADYERNSRRPIRKEYWMKQGFDEETAIQLAVDTKNRNNKKGAAVNANNANSITRRVTSKRCKEYYLARGYNDEEANQELAKSQVFFSKKICIDKFGKEKGMQIWSARQKKWKESLKQSGIYLGVSNSSLYFFNELAKHIPEIQYGINEPEIVCENNIFFVDCLYRNKKKIIEFYGDYWHANPTRFHRNSKIKQKKAAEIWDKDQERISILQNHGYEVLVVWESEAKENISEIIKKCITFLT